MRGEWTLRGARNIIARVVTTYNLGFAQVLFNFLTLSVYDTLIDNTLSQSNANFDQLLIKIYPSRSKSHISLLEPLL